MEAKAPYKTGIRATVTSCQERKSYYGGHTVYLMTMKDDQGESYRCWLDPKNGNFRRWQNYLMAGVMLENLMAKGKGLIDADSIPALVGE